MEIDGQHGSKLFCYNTHISRRRDLLFDIVPNIGKQVRPNFHCLEYWPEVGMMEGKTPYGELRKRIRRPQQVRNISVLGFVAKPLTLHNEKPNTTVRRVAITRRALYSCFSLRLLAAPATEWDSEGAPLFFFAPRRQLSL